jgi:mRNA interferase MazF
LAREILRKGIYWANLDPTIGVEQSGTRPIVVVSIDSFNTNSQSAIAFAITSKEPKVLYPLVYQLPPNLLPKPSWVKLTQIRTLSSKRLGSFIANISEEDFEQIMSGFNRICGY